MKLIVSSLFSLKYICPNDPNVQAILIMAKMMSKMLNSVDWAQTREESSA